MAWVRQYWLRPRLQIKFSERVEGCANDTKYVDNKSIERWLRILIKNTGRSTALSVSASIIKLELETPGVGKNVATFTEEVFDLKWVYRGLQARDLAPGAHRYLDIVHAERDNSALIFDFEPNPPRLRLRGFGDRGTYMAVIFATAGNAKSVETRVKWSWDGKFPALTIIDIERRSTILSPTFWRVPFGAGR
jgi:hypothetical protein